MKNKKDKLIQLENIILLELSIIQGKARLLKMLSETKDEDWSENHTRSLNDLLNKK